MSDDPDVREGDPTRDPPGKRHREEALKLKREDEQEARLDAEIDEVEAYRMPLMEHLIELKNRLIWAIGAIILGALVGFYFAQDLFAFLAAPYEDTTGNKLVLVHSPFEGIYAWFRVSIIAGLVFASPMVSYQAWAFVAPGLYKAERKLVVPLSMASVFLFLLGGAFCYYVIFPYAFPFFVSVLPDTEAQISADGYLKAVIRMMLAFGICFQLPVGTWFVARAGMVDHRDMISGFRYAVVVIFVLAALITPPDPLTQMLLAVPMILLYGVSIVIAYFVSTKERVASTEGS